jgi:leucyl-tRNA synthetase
LGGAEHAVLHLLYARFWVKVLQDLKLLDFPEPFLRLRSVGMVLAADGKKMSKSLGNVVNPDEMVAKYGSDAVRMYEMFMGPWEQAIAWDSGAISGQVRFLGRVRETVRKNREQLQSSEHSLTQGSELGGQTSPVLAAKLKTLVERVERGVLEQKFNTSIAGLMEFVNSWRETEMVLSKEHVEMFASLLSLFAPIMATEIATSHTGYVMWPDVLKIEGMESVMVTIAVQVNGKLRGTMEMLNSECRIENRVVELALGDERVKKWVTGEPKKVIFVPGKLVNIVMGVNR